MEKQTDTTALGLGLMNNFPNNRESIPKENGKSSGNWAYIGVYRDYVL